MDRSATSGSHSLTVLISSETAMSLPELRNYVVGESGGGIRPMALQEGRGNGK